MKIFLLGITLAIAAAVDGQIPGGNVARTRTILFDQGWQFLKGSPRSAFREHFDDSRWRKLDLPHDWSIEDLPGPVSDSISGPFSKASAGGAFTGHTVGGEAWYRKKFSLPPSAGSKSVYIQFDGVYTLADVWINGQYLGDHPNGYTPFYYNVTSVLHRPGRPNIIAVRVRNQGRNSRWYSGSGIYRHVWLTIAEPVHILPQGIYVSTPLIASGNARVSIETTVRLPRNTRDLTIQTRFFAPNGRLEATVSAEVPLSGGRTAIVKQEALIRHAKLWSVETPALYSARVYILAGRKQLDSSSISFGIRSVKMDARKGLLLNGKRVILKGGCVHHDNGPLGAAAIDRAEERRLEILKANGYNAIRTSHNPPSPNFLDVCDRLGLLVIDEAFDVWEHKKLFDDAMDYHHFFKEWWQQDLRSFIKRDRNHPSVILWSIGNEIYERADSSGLRIAKQLIAEIHSLDTSRKITQGLCWFWDHPGRPWDSLQPAFALLDVAGYNYEHARYKDDHQKYPSRLIIGTETYAKDAYENFDFAEKNPYVLGDFVWTAWDYMGEAGIGHSSLKPDSVKEDKSMLLPWPWFNAWCGDLDFIGEKKPQSFYRDVVWRNSKVELMVKRPSPAGMHYVPNNWGWPDELKSWTWGGWEGRPVSIRVFSRSDRIRLFLNDSIIAEKDIPGSSLTATFDITYAPGTLRAVAIEKGVPVAADSLTTAGPPAGIRLRSDRKSVSDKANDLVYVTAEIVDEAGNLVPDIAVPIEFSINNTGSIAAIANADPKDISGFRQPVKNTFQGRALVILRPTKKGKIKLGARAAGLKDGVAVVAVE